MASPRRRIISLSVHALRQFDSNVCQLYPKGAMMKENAYDEPYHADSIAPNVIEWMIVNDSNVNDVTYKSPSQADGSTGKYKHAKAMSA